MSHGTNWKFQQQNLNIPGFSWGWVQGQNETINETFITLKNNNNNKKWLTVQGKAKREVYKN